MTTTVERITSVAVTAAQAARLEEFQNLHKVVGVSVVKNVLIIDVEQSDDESGEYYTCRYAVAGDGAVFVFHYQV